MCRNQFEQEKWDFLQMPRAVWLLKYVEETETAFKLKDAEH